MQIFIKICIPAVINVRQKWQDVEKWRHTTNGKANVVCEYTSDTNVNIYDTKVLEDTGQRIYVSFFSVPRSGNCMNLVNIWPGRLACTSVPAYTKDAFVFILFSFLSLLFYHFHYHPKKHLWNPCKCKNWFGGWKLAGGWSGRSRQTTNHNNFKMWRIDGATAI